MTESTTQWNTGPVIWKNMSISSYLNRDQTYGQRLDAEMKLQTPGDKDLHLDDQSKRILIIQGVWAIPLQR